MDSARIRQRDHIEKSIGSTGNHSSKQESDGINSGGID